MFWNFLSSSLLVGRFSIDDISLATSSRFFSWILPTGFHVSISFLFGWSGSCLLYLSTVSMRDLFLVRSLGLILASISQAAVGVVRIAPQMSLRAWFCTLSKDRTAPLLERKIVIHNSSHIPYVQLS